MVYSCMRNGDEGAFAGDAAIGGVIPPLEFSTSQYSRFSVEGWNGHQPLPNAESL
jgi:hypothetical protein